MDEPRESKAAELDALRQKVTELEGELQEPPQHWQATEFYGAYYATTGFMLGMFGAVTSLLFNVVGSLLVGEHPIQSD